MSAVNPVFLLPGRLSEAAAELGAAFVGSLTLGAGQFCTNPGIVIGIDGPDLDRFTGAARDAVAASPPAPMLTGRIAASYADGVARLADHPGTEVIALGADPGRETGRRAGAARRWWPPPPTSSWPRGSCTTRCSAPPRSSSAPPTRAS